MASLREATAISTIFPQVVASRTAMTNSWRQWTRWSSAGRHSKPFLVFDAWPYAQKPVFVLSSRPIAAAPPGAVVEHLSGAPHEIVLELAARGLQHIYVDAGVTIQRFLQAGLIQRLISTRVPVLIGSGIPLFGAAARCFAHARGDASVRERACAERVRGGRLTGACSRPRPARS